MNRHVVILLSALSLAAASCAEPVSIEQYVKTGDRDVYGRYLFQIDMSDSTSAYDMDVYARMNSTERKFRHFRQMPMTVLLESPDGRCYEGKSLIARDMMTDSTYYWKTMHFRLATDIVPVVSGGWKLYLSMPEDSVSKYGVEGLGVSVTKHYCRREGAAEDGKWVTVN